MAAGREHNEGVTYWRDFTFRRTKPYQPPRNGIQAIVLATEVEETEAPAVQEQEVGAAAEMAEATGRAGRA